MEINRETITQRLAELRLGMKQIDAKLEQILITKHHQEGAIAALEQLLNQSDSASIETPDDKAP